MGLQRRAGTALAAEEGWREDGGSRLRLLTCQPLRGACTRVVYLFFEKVVPVLYLLYDASWGSSCQRCLARCRWR